MGKIIGIGASVLDTYILLDSYPTEDKKMKANDIFQMGGGPVGNALVAVSILGGNARVLGGFADDAYGLQLISEYKRFGVDTSKVIVQKHAKSFTSTLLINSSLGTRTCLFDRGNVNDDEKYIDLKNISKDDILHLDGNYLKEATFAAKYAKSNGILVSLDAGGLYPGIEDLLPYVDILIPSEEFALKITNTSNVDDAIIALQNKYSPKVLVITQGSNGGTFYQNGIKHYKSFKINCIDSNGAGDTFHGAFLFKYSQTNDIVESIKFASATSAIKCTKSGVRNALPTNSEVEKFLEKEKFIIC